MSQNRRWKRENQTKEGSRIAARSLGDCFIPCTGDTTFRSRLLKPCDVVAATIEKIGSLSNPVLEEPCV
jgi:2-keto-4-pentenoate hydratase/2-oxohepta-3-ene-1,7-dioic acid hydratase in catechol pathway